MNRIIIASLITLLIAGCSSESPSNTKSIETDAVPSMVVEEMTISIEAPVAIEMDAPMMIEQLSNEEIQRFKEIDRRLMEGQQQVQISVDARLAEECARKLEYFREELQNDALTAKDREYLTFSMEQTQQRCNPID